MSGIPWDIPIKDKYGHMVFEQYPVMVDAAPQGNGFDHDAEIYAIYSGEVDLLASDEPHLAEWGVYCLRYLRRDDDFKAALCAFHGIYPTGSTMDPATSWRIAE